MKKIFVLLLTLAVLTLSACSMPEILAEETETTLSPTVTVTFPEGFTAVQIAERLEENSVCSAADFIAAVNGYNTAGSDMLSQIKNADERPFLLEGYIFPDTYEFYRGEPAEKALSRFLRNTERKLTAELPERARELGYTTDEILALASIIQKEAKPAEMKKVSSVLHNRLKSPGYPNLQCDATVHYINDYVTGSPYLADDTAKFAPLYNTYKKKALPAGAICNPGIDAIDAALYPDETGFYFFVTDKEQNYYYAATFEEHKENCKKCGIG